MSTAYCFIDGGYLRAAARKYNKPLVDPRVVADTIAYSGFVQTWRRPGVAIAMTKHNTGLREIGLARVLYYDARPDEGDNSPITEYWKAIEVLPDTEIGFGTVREDGLGGKKKLMASSRWTRWLVLSVIFLRWQSLLLVIATSFQL